MRSTNTSKNWVRFCNINYTFFLDLRYLCALIFWKIEFENILVTTYSCTLERSCWWCPFHPLVVYTYPADGMILYSPDAVYNPSWAKNQTYKNIYRYTWWPNWNWISDKIITYFWVVMVCIGSTDLNMVSLSTRFMAIINSR